MHSLDFTQQCPHWWNALENPLGVPQPHLKFCFPIPSRALPQSR